MTDLLRRPVKFDLSIVLVLESQKSARKYDLPTSLVKIYNAKKYSKNNVYLLVNIFSLDYFLHSAGRVLVLKYLTYTKNKYYSV